MSGVGPWGAPPDEDTPETIDENTPDTSGGGPLVPAWVWNPAATIRGVIFRPIVEGILGIALTLIGLIMTLFRGSEPGFSRDEQVWGLADIPGMAVDFGLDVTTWTITTLFDVLIDVNRSLVPAAPSIIDVAVIYVLVILELVILGELAIRLFRAVLDAIPVASGVETFLWK